MAGSGNKYIIKITITLHYSRNVIKEIKVINQLNPIRQWFAGTQELSALEQFWSKPSEKTVVFPEGLILSPPPRAESVVLTRRWGSRTTRPYQHSGSEARGNMWPGSLSAPRTT